jgi:aminoglycoside phosphotransferase (APT) family kinase protein
MTVLDGSSKIPTVTSTARLRGLGAAAASVHGVVRSASPALPLRLRPLADVDFDARRRSTGSSALLEAAALRVSEAPLPDGPTVFVHGDLWQGNTVWAGATLVGLVDWDAAGVGHPGIDLGTLRCDAAVVFGPPAAAEILHGWRQIAARADDMVAYWDLVAALTTPTDMTEWLSVAHEHGRVDLEGRILAQRRDAFIRTALFELDRM